MNFLIILLVLSSQLYSQTGERNFNIKNCQQLIVVVTESPSLPNGKLYRFNKSNSNEWKSLSDPIQIIVGKKGLAKSTGLIPLQNLGLEQKVEGDGKSPAGIFSLTTAFGFASETELGNLKIPYIQIEEGSECIDDPNSEYYNQILQKENEKVDWNSSEKMWKADPWYRFGVIIDANNSPVRSGNGSCLFLHNWDGPDDTTVGCTAMDSSVMKDIVFWLDTEKNPLLVQLTTEQYMQNRKLLGLPELD